MPAQPPPTTATRILLDLPLVSRVVDIVLALQGAPPRRQRLLGLARPLGDLLERPPAHVGMTAAAENVERRRGGIELVGRAPHGVAAHAVLGLLPHVVLLEMEAAIPAALALVAPLLAEHALDRHLRRQPL